MQRTVTANKPEPVRNGKKTGPKLAWEKIAVAPRIINVISGLWVDCQLESGVKGGAGGGLALKLADFNIKKKVFGVVFVRKRVYSKN